MNDRHTVRFCRIPGIPGAFHKEGTGAHAERVHAHKEHSISIVRSGITRVQIAEEWCTIREGQGIYLPPGVPHLCSPDNPSAFCYEVFYWPDPSPFESEQNLTESARNGPEIIDARETRKVETDVSSRLRLLLARRTGTTFQKADCRPSVLGVTAKQLILNEGERSRYQTYRLCRAMYGIGPHAIEQNFRIEKAKRFLAAGRAVAETAAACGFCDQSHFDRVFRLYTGAAPSEFKFC